MPNWVVVIMQKAMQSEVLNIDTILSEIIALNGTFQAFKINNGVDDEYFFAHVDTDNGILSKGYRGNFYNNAYIPNKRIKIADGDTITLLKTHYAFCVNDGATILTTTNEPTESGTEPTSPDTGDFWLDTSGSVSIWKKYSGAIYETANATFVGWAVFDSSKCVVGRSADFYRDFKADNNMEVDLKSVTEIIAKNIGARLNVYGAVISFPTFAPIANITLNLAGADDMYNATEQPDTNYYWYISDVNTIFFSDISPHWRPDLKGYYFPHHTWRCVCQVYNSSGGDFSGIVYNIYNDKKISTQGIHYYVHAGYGSTNTHIPYYTSLGELSGERLASIENSSVNGFSITILKKCTLTMNATMSKSLKRYGNYKKFHAFVYYILRYKQG